VRQAFARHRAAYLKGDWTRGGATITQFLRAPVPARPRPRRGAALYRLSGRRRRAQVLPQILTEAEVLSALGKLDPS